ncbi:MAG: GIY-YIG nuclease family protein [Myxacorys californica WJT36-NPBG1]|jgi:hypothetical protein|nr:GIY-YIG nuclease family protein [Myxacorys californica WJT36-NPBG1]
MSAPSGYFATFDRKALDLIQEWHFTRQETNPSDWKEAQTLVDIPMCCSGVYAVVAQNELLYVGQAQNIRVRLKTHGRRAAFAAHKAIYRYIESDRRRMLEQLVILKHSPKLNRTPLKTLSESV